MPIPIKPTNDYSRDDKSLVDYSMFFTNTPAKKTVTASNKDASLLFELWTKCERGNSPDELKLGATPVNSRDILRLKTLGFIQGQGDQVQFTKKGKLVITTMALGEESEFDKKATQKSYTEILASMSKRGKKGFRIAGSDPKFSIDNNNRLNLKG